MLIVPLALMGIFLLLVSAFGNFRDAFIVMINVPFAAIGGVIALHLAAYFHQCSAICQQYPYSTVSTCCAQASYSWYVLLDRLTEIM